jgi:hypothetical protein
MYATSSTVMYIWTEAANPHSPLTSSRRACSTPTTESTSAPDASFTTQVLHTGCGADRWNRFLSNVSHAAERSGFNPGSDALIVAKWWREHSRVWASPATVS